MKTSLARAAATISMIITPLVAHPDKVICGEQSFSRVERIGQTTERYFFVFKTSAGDFTIRQDGHAEVNSPNVRRRNFELKIGGPGRLERIYFVEFEGDVLFAYELSDQNSGWGFVMRLDQKSMKTRWITSLSGYNLGPGLVDATAGYFTSANSLLKLDLQSGARLWEIADLEKQFSPPFVEFDLPRLKGDAVLFPEVNRGRVIQVSRNEGTILK
jgi:hypothetical protein